jgi:hypothetical protein
MAQRAAVRPISWPIPGQAPLLPGMSTVVWVLAERRPPRRSNPVLPRAGVAPWVEGPGTVAVEPDFFPQVKDLQLEERIQTYPFTKSKPKIINSRLGFEIESGWDPLPFTPLNSPIKCSPDDYLGQPNRAAIDPHELPSPTPWLEELQKHRSPSTVLGGGKLPPQAIEELFPSVSYLGWESPPPLVHFRPLSDEIPSSERHPDPSRASSNGAAAVCVRPHVTP